jgi:hypothetical protein
MAKSKAGKAKSAAEGAWTSSSPYVQRFMEDEDTRENVRVALDNVRSAYTRLLDGKSPPKVVMDDKRFQKEVRQAAASLRDATTALREGPQPSRRGGGLGKLLLLAIVGAVLAVALNEGVRNKVLDLLFGKEEEFDYSATTPAATTPPGPPASSPAPMA